MNFTRFQEGARWIALDAVIALSATAALGGKTFLAPVFIALMALSGLYRSDPRYYGFREGARFFAVALTTVVLVSSDVKTASLLLNALLFLTGGTRALTRRAGYLRRRSEGEPVRTLMVGAGDAADVVLRELARTERPTHRIVGLLDDDPRKAGTRLRSVSVVGTTTDVAREAARLKAQEILIAIPSADGARMREIVDRCRATDIRVRTLPGVCDLLDGTATLPQSRQVAIEDLLRRRPASVDSGLGSSAIGGKTVLITGGGGSIGTELARQVARLKPKRLILLGRGENSLFEARQKMVLEGLPEPELVVADVRDAANIRALFARLRPDVVFHAAAHKHVPLMESAPIEAFRNNVLGTRNVLRAAVEFGTERFTLVSTDKAVRPGNVMGATKRLAELLTIDVARRHRLAYAVVRFGNVLNSRGSLVPSLVAQMASGGPVRITDERMTRYFMTIPEAAGLIVHAGASAEPGAIYILDMGDPVRIVDLANDLMRLHGFEPNVTMPVVVTGARPGEKLHEELVYDAEELWPTAHPSIRAAMPSAEEAWGIGPIVDRIAALADAGDAESVRAMMLCPPSVVVSVPVGKAKRIAA